MIVLISNHYCPLDVVGTFSYFFRSKNVAGRKFYVSITQNTFQKLERNSDRDNQEKVLSKKKTNFE